jgi:peptidoglycan/LPS O-acetylase OafA/YrhL
MGQRLGHRPGLDGVRALAIGGVMGLHAIARVFPAGLFGVDIFFVLSAFLITTLIIEELDDRHGQFSFRSFYARRALRLGPALLLWLALIAAPTAVAIHESDRIGLSTFVSLFYLGDLTPALGWHMGSAYQHVWSLAIEEQFYALWPAALLLLYARRIPANVVSVSLGAAVVIAFASMHAFSTNYFLPTGHLVALTAGCVAAYLFKRGHRGRLETIIRNQVLGGLLIVTLCLAFVAYRSASDNLGFVVQAAICAGTAALILHLCWSEGHSIASRLMTLPPVL